MVYTSSVVVGQYYHYYNVTQDPLEAINLYYDPTTKQIVNSLEAAGMSWISQVGTTEYPGVSFIYIVYDCYILVGLPVLIIE